jgi:organic hydroperoxide reductase OsmC/OhrA
VQKQHEYAVAVEWTGNRGTGTSAYRDYGREHEIRADGKPPIPGSSDPGFRGDPSRYNPEDLLVASLSSCHMLWYLHLCATHGIVVTRYLDRARGRMIETEDGGGRFVEVVLRPEVTVRAGVDLALARRLHHEAHEKCFIANSVNFPVELEPAFLTE